MARAPLIVAALLAVLWTEPLRSQQATGTIRGRVTDEATQQPLSSVTVSVGDRSALTQTDGRYILTAVPATADSLRAQLLGYDPASQAVAVTPDQTLVLDFVMSAHVQSLAQMVAVGYGQRSAGAITGAVTQVDTESFNTGRIIGPAQLIHNKIPGVEIVDNNEPGGGLSIRIRGTTSVNGSTEPLYVVDGMPVNGVGGGVSINGQDPLNSLNPDDILSISVLRDASSAAIYGGNASSGVVLIQTKSGRRGTHFEYSGSMSGSTINGLPSMLNASQFRSAVMQYGDSSSQAQLLNANTDWFRVVDRNAIGQDHNLAVSGADENTNWRLSLGYLNQEGVLQANNIQRLALGVHLEQALFNDRLELRTDLRGSHEDDQFTPDDVLSNALVMGPTQPVYSDTTATGYYNYSGLIAPSNPVEILNLAWNKGSTSRGIGIVQADYRVPFLESLRLSLNVGYDAARGHQELLYPSTVNSQIKTGVNGSDYQQDPSSRQSLLEPYLTYAALLRFVPGTIHLTGGYSRQKSRAEYRYCSAVGFGTSVPGPDCAVSPTVITTSQHIIEEDTLTSFFGRVNYDWDGRYLIAMSLRRDKSSRFAPGNAAVSFPSVAGAWRVSGERFLQGVSWLSDLKLRASWAKTGNQNLAGAQSSPTYQVGSVLDPNIKWETTSSTNFGADVAVLDNRLTAAVDIYNKITNDMYAVIPIAAGVNFSNFVLTNFGSMTNKGVEFSLGWRALQGGGNHLGWTLGFSGSHNTNQITSLGPITGITQIPVGAIAGGVGTTIQVLEAGQAANSFFVCRQAYQTGKPLEGQYYNLAGDSVVSGCSNNLRAYHDPAPQWILTHTSYLTYGKFDLSFTLRASLGNYVYNNVASVLGDYQELNYG
ncbi:MAG TPA: SusC/RagA family TonB-linked outer membrane protein, partial [Gemmatimonadales bacterium]|nr:SusC/RagA family TonB-linked outer membrane protein [Gemmatimonadales bacterium]